MRSATPLQLAFSPFDPYGTPMSRGFEKRLCDILKNSLVVNFRKKNQQLFKTAFVCECCRIKHDKYCSYVELPAPGVRGNKEYA